MDPIRLYGFAAGGVIIFLFVYHTTTTVSKWVQNRTIYFVLKHLVYPILIRRNHYLVALTRWRAFWTILYYSATITCNLVGIRTTREAGERAGVLALLNIAPLLTSNHLNFAADLLGLSLDTSLKIHSTVGLVAVIQGAIHVAIFATRNKLNLEDKKQFYGVLVGTSILCLFLLSLIRNLLFELYQITHYALAIFTAYALWFHFDPKFGFIRIYLTVAVAVFIGTSVIRYLRLVFRNVRWHRPYSTATVMKVQDAIRLKIQVSKPWDIKAGQHVYVWMPGTSFWSVLQSHPFMVTWWDHNPSGKGSNIYLLVQPKAGFTQKLMRHPSGATLAAWVDGPYGKSTEAAKFGSLLMIATGIGIAALVPYVKSTLAALRNATARTRNILLVWQLDKESDQDWVQDWMTELLDEDKGTYILKIHLYVLRDFEDKDISYGERQEYGDHDRIRKFYGKPQFDSIISSEIANRRGQLLITTSANETTRDKVRKLMNQDFDKDIRLVNLDFQPREYRSLWSSRLPDIGHEGVA